MTFTISLSNVYCFCLDFFSVRFVLCIVNQRTSWPHFYFVFIFKVPCSKRVWWAWVPWAGHTHSRTCKKHRRSTQAHASRDCMKTRHARATLPTPSQTL